MIYLIWISASSLAFIILMVSYRSYELSAGKQIFSDSFRNKSDRKVLTFLGKNIILFNRFYSLLVSRLLKTSEFAGHKSHDIWQVFSKKVDQFFERVKGKKPMNKKGSLSLYWQSFDSRKDINK